MQTSCFSLHRKLKIWRVVHCLREKIVSAAGLQKADAARQRENWQVSFPRKGELVFCRGIKRDNSYMAFILPKSKHGSTRLCALWLPQDQNPGTSQILLHSCLSLLHRMTVWLPSCLSSHCLQALPHSRACNPPTSGYTFPSSGGSVSLVSFSLTMATPSPLSFIRLPFSFTDLFEQTLDLNWEDWDILNDLINEIIFSKVGCSNCSWKCGTC